MFVLTAVQEAPLSLAPGEGVGKPEGQTAFASKSHLLSGFEHGVDLIVESAPEQCPLE
jgi:hypothetical protein